MDLHDRQQHNYAQRLLNFYLEKTGDYAATQILFFILCTVPWSGLKWRQSEHHKWRVTYK